MKWFLFVLACVCLYLAHQLGMQVEKVEYGRTEGHMGDSSSAAAAAVDISSGYNGGALGCAAIGAASALGAALIQISDNKTERPTSRSIVTE